LARSKLLESKVMATKTLLTSEQFEQLPDDGMRHELDEGELISMPPTFGVHGMIQTQTASILWNFVRPQLLGWVLSETGFRLSAETVRAPDVSFIRAEQTGVLDPERRFECAPDLAIEIISPSETAAEIAHKVRQYLRAGSVVWVLYPKDRTVHVFEPTKSARVLDAEDMLEAPGLLPGFSVRVSEFFD
jgi:Uma2 family endonuclease